MCVCVCEMGGGGGGKQHRRLPPFATAQTFCASRDGPKYPGFERTVLTKRMTFLRSLSV